jgi:hypothetical protein
MRIRSIRRLPPHVSATTSPVSIKEKRENQKDARHHTPK